MKVIAGLGNPGRQYERTRHNVGFRVVDELAQRLGLNFRRSWTSSVACCAAELSGHKVLLVKPLAYMNRSGEALAPYLRKKGVKPEQLLVVVDDLSLDPGQLRLRRDGSAGGHNGLKSLITHLGTSDFTRLRVGIGRSCAKHGVVDYVLAPARAEEAEILEAAVKRAADAIELVLRSGLEAAMNAYNSYEGRPSAS